MKKIINKIVIIIALITITSSVFLLTACEAKRGRTVEEDTVFYLDLEKCKIKKFNFNMSGIKIVDESSNITLRKDGTATMQIKLKSGLSNLANVLLKDVDLESVHVDSVFLEMAKEYFPGFSVYDLEGTFARLESALGLTLLGLDVEDEYIQNLFINLQEEGTLPSPLIIPNGLGVEYNADYYIKDVESQYSGKYTGVYMGNHHDNGDPFVIMDYIENPDGKDQIVWINEIIDLKIYATQA